MLIQPRWGARRAGGDGGAKPRRGRILRDQPASFVAGLLTSPPWPAIRLGKRLGLVGVRPLADRRGLDDLVRLDPVVRLPRFARWPALPEATRRSILALVRAAGGGAEARERAV